MRLKHFFFPVVFCIYVMLLWVLNPRLVLALAQRGESAVAVGIFAAMPFITILLVTPFLQGLTRRFGLKRFFIICLLFETVLLGGRSGSVCLNNYSRKISGTLAG